MDYALMCAFMTHAGEPRRNRPESMWELNNIDIGRIANPIEYMQMRRRRRRRMEQFEHITENDLPTMCDELAWHRQTARYPKDEPRTRYRPARVAFSVQPTGLGTSAFRLAGALAEVVDRPEVNAVGN